MPEVEAEYSTSAEYDPAGANAIAPQLLTLPEPLDEGTGGSLLGYPGAGIPPFLRSSFAIDGIPVDVNSFMQAVNSHFASSFDVLQATINGSTRVIGTRTITRFREHWRYSPAGIERSERLDFMGIETLSVTTQPIYDYSSWGFSFAFGSQKQIYPSPGKNPFPAITGDKLTSATSALNLAKQVTAKQACDEALKDVTNGAISSLSALVAKMSINGNIFDGSKSTLGIVINKKDTDVQAFFKERKEDVGAAVVSNFFTGRGDITFLNSYFFSPTAGFSDQQRALILIHEAVHQFGGKDDKFFDSSSRLTTLIAEKCFPALNAAKWLGKLSL